MTVQSRYRDDIQGMRAIAVLAVIVFHIWPESLHGGFLGVDMFFTISGYLITNNMLRAHASATFSISTFYTRRIKRLLPAVMFLLTIVLCVGSVALLPEDFAALSLSAVFSSMSAANFYFYLFVDTGYFAASSNEQPLLHLWSLGVEEQFYLIWPLLLAALLKLKRRETQFLVIASLALASVVLGELTLSTSPDFAYYMLPTRACELLAGALLALTMNTYTMSPLPNLAVRGLGLLGLVGVAGCFYFQSEHDGFPGLSTLPITLSTLLLLGAGAFGRSSVPLLGSLPMRWLGDTSYSLYLWHWPVLAFARYALISIDLHVGLVLFMVIVGLASISYYLVEQPFRNTSLSMGQTATRYLFLPATLFAVVGGLLHFSGGISPWTNVKALEQARVKSDPPFRADYVCQKPHLTQKDIMDPRCIVGDLKGIEPNVLLWGDSNAAHFAGMLKVIAEAGGFSFRNVAHSACPPVFGNTDQFTSNRYRERCRLSRPIVEAALPNYDVVILGASWQTYQAFDSQFYAHLVATIEKLVRSGKQVVLLSYIQRFASLNRSCAARGVQMSFIDCQSLFTIPGPTLYDMNERLYQLSLSHTNIHYFDANQYLCQENRCSAYLGSKLLYYDKGHLSARGSELLGEHILRSQGLPDFVKVLTSAQ